MTVTVLAGPVGRRPLGATIRSLADAAELTTRLRARGREARLVSALEPEVLAHPDAGPAAAMVDADVFEPAPAGAQRHDGISAAGPIARRLAQVAPEGTVHAVGWRAAAVASTARAGTGTPVVAHADQLPSWPGDDRLDGSVLGRLGWAALAAADAVLVENEWARGVATSRGVPSGMVRVANPGVAASTPIDPVVLGDDEQVSVLSVGDPADVGSLRPVAEAVLHHPGARLVVGRTTGMDDACAAVVKERLRTLPVVRRLGTRCVVERRPAGDVCSEAHLVVDVSSQPGRGLGVLSAMAACRAVVVSGTGGADEVVVDRVTGLVVEPRDRTGTRSAVADLMRDAFRLEAYGLAGHERVLAAYDPERFVEVVTTLHDDLTGSPAGDAQAVMA
jgi:D-inositol-3-phosphate glycosyltransferase